MKKTKNLLFTTQFLILTVLSISLAGCMNDSSEIESNLNSESFYEYNSAPERSLTNTGYIQGH